MCVIKDDLVNRGKKVCWMILDALHRNVLKPVCSQLFDLIVSLTSEYRNACLCSLLGAHCGHVTAAFRHKHEATLCDVTNSVCFLRCHLRAQTVTHLPVHCCVCLV